MNDQSRSDRPGASARRGWFTCTRNHSWPPTVTETSTTPTLKRRATSASVAIDRLADPALVRDAGRDGLVEGASRMPQRGQGQRERLERLRLGGISREDLGDAEPLFQVPRGAAQLLRRRHDDDRRARRPRDAPQLGQQGEAVEARQRQVGHHQLGQLAAPQHRLRLIAVPRDDGFVASQLDQIADHPGPARVGVRNQDVGRPGWGRGVVWGLAGCGGRHSWLNDLRARLQPEGEYT